MSASSPSIGATLMPFTPGPPHANPVFCNPKILGSTPTIVPFQQSLVVISLYLLIAPHTPHMTFHVFIYTGTPFPISMGST